MELIEFKLMMALMENEERRTGQFARVLPVRASWVCLNWRPRKRYSKKKRESMVVQLETKFDLGKRSRLNQVRFAKSSTRRRRTYHHDVLEEILASKLNLTNGHPNGKEHLEEQGTEPRPWSSG